MQPYSLNIGGKLFPIASTQVMGIINLTSDSFYQASRKEKEKELVERTFEIISEGGNFIDVGACSTRPNSILRSAAEEAEALRWGLQIITRLPEVNNIPISIDTFRADIAKMCVEEYGATIINDVSAGKLDEKMFPTIAKLRVPYVLTFCKGWQDDGGLKGNVVQQMAVDISTHLNELRELGICDIIIDPGFGFGKSFEQNWQLLSGLQATREFNLPVMAGVSRKSMIFRYLGCQPGEALNGTSVVHTLAMLSSDIHFLRVHDVKECVECVKLVEQYKKMLFSDKFIFSSYDSIWN